MSETSSSSVPIVQRLTNIQKRTTTICEVAKLAFDSKMFRNEIKAISQRYNYCERSIVSSMPKGINNATLADREDHHY